LSGCDGGGGRNPAGIVCYDARGNGDGLAAPAITGDHNGRVTDYTAIVAAFNGHKSASGSIQYAEEAAPTIEANMPPNVVAFSPKATAGADGNIGHGDKSPTLRSAPANVPAICCRPRRDKCRLRQGWPAICVATAQANAEICGDKAPTLNCLHEQPIVCWPKTAPTHSHVLRRLTPTECERLMGLPDGWTAGHSDTARYKAIGNSVAVPCAEFVMKRIAEII
jgi:site-specific DNA-cytosine methylase